MKESDFLIIGITSPLFFKGEGERINHLLDTNEMHYLHLRKPGSTPDQLKSLIKEINPINFPKIKLHDHFFLLEEFPLGGIHLNSRNNVIHPLAKEISRSFHSLEEITECKEELSYFFISPIFDSISKEGYKSAFKIEEIKDIIRGKKGIALGGVTPDKFHILKSAGFYGAAMLGYFFPNSKE